MKKISLVLSLFISALFLQTSCAQTIDTSDLESKIDAMIPASVEEDTPGLVVGIVKDGEVIFSKGYGMANLSYNMPNDPNMVYNIGSVAKQFLGYAFAMLHVEGKLNIDDPVTKYLDNWPEFEHEVKLRHLLTHTSGYREAYTISNLAGRNIGVDRLSQEECLNVVRRQPKLEFVPGSRHTYNSTAWVILSEVLKKVTGTDADVWVKEHILEPLQMNDTQIESFVGQLITNAAESYSPRGNTYVNEKSNRAIFGAADIVSNIPDLAKWVHHFKTASIGGTEVQKVFLEPFILNDGSNSGYALGIGNNTYKGLKRYRHTGGHEAFSTQVSYFPDYDLGIITFSNYGRRGWLDTSKIADLLLVDLTEAPKSVTHSPVKVEESDIRKFAGKYVASTLNNTYDLEFKNGALVTRIGKKLIPTGNNEFHIENSPIKYIFRNNPDGRTDLTIVGNTSQTFTKLNPWSPKNTDLDEYSGDYWSDELETVYHLSVKNNQVIINHRWVGTIPLTAVAKDYFQVSNLFVKFLRNEAGDVKGLSVNSGRTLNVIFDKK